MSEQNQMGQMGKDLRARFKVWGNYLANTFEGRPTTEFSSEESLERRKKITHFIYHVVLAASMALILGRSDYDTSWWTTLSPGDLAEEDIVSPITAQIEPKETSKNYRENLAKRIPPVFDYDDQALERWLRLWKKTFKTIRTDFYDGKKTPKGNITLEKIEQTIAEYTGKKIRRQPLHFLYSTRFSEETERSFQKLGGFLIGRIIAPTDLFESYHSTGITVRQINQSMQETLIQDVSHIWSVEMATEYLYQIADKLGAHQIPSPRATAELVASTLIPNLKPNENLSKKRIAIVLTNLKDPIQSVKKGKVILQKGDRLTDSSIELLQTILSLTSPAGKIKRYFYTFGLLLIFFMILFRINMTGRGFWHLPLKDACFFYLISLLTIGTTKLVYPYIQALCEHFSMTTGSEYLIPVATGGILIHLMMGKDAGYTYALVASVIVGYMLDSNFRFTVWAFVVNAAAIQSLRSCKQRTDLIKAGAWCGGIGALLVLLFTLIDLMGQKQYSLTRIIAEPTLAFISGLVSSMITTIITPFLESVFRYTTSLKLLELSNFNHPLLHTLMMKAPGTYHHSVIVGSLAELASDKVNGNGLLARVSAYYHDIGKMNKPLYFIENQTPNSNPHDHLSPMMSAKILFSHVKNGVRMGKEYSLGKKIIDIIEQHHGTTLASYFFNKAKQSNDPTLQTVEESHFRYPGPKPRTREAGIVMLADACEAATRSITDPTPIKIQAMVHNIITKRFLEEQFSDCDLTLRDLQVIEDTFTRTLVSLYHHRIEYPGQRNFIANAEQKKAQGS